MVIEAIFSLIHTCIPIGKTYVDYIKGPSEPSATNAILPPQKRPLNIKQVETEPKKRKIANLDKESSKDELFETFKVIEEKRCAAELKICDLKLYNLILRNMQIERNLGNFHIYTYIYLRYFNL